MEFDSLKDLVRIITRHKAKKIDLIGGTAKSGDLADQLYDGISKGKINSDAEAARYFFGTNNTKDPAYRKVKVRLARQLINTSFFIDVDQPMFSDRQRAMSNCYRDFAAAYLLMQRNDAKKAGLWLLEQVLEQSMKYDFVELTADVTRTLRAQYARTIGDSDMHALYVDLNRKYEALHRAEMLASDYYEELIRYYMNQRSPSSEIHKLASRYYQELLPSADQVDLASFYFYTYQIGTIMCLSVNDNKGALEICDVCLEKLVSKKNSTTGSLVLTAIQKVVCLIQMRIFDHQAEETIKFCLERVEEGVHNWFKVMETYFHYCLHARRYEDALEIFSRVTRHPRYELLAGSARDEWKLYGAYLHLMAQLNVLDGTQVEEVAGPFKLSKFHSDFTIVDKDKEGLNIPRMFLPVLYRLAEDSFWDSDISTDALDKYRQRYLNNELNQRSDTFMRLVIALAKREFNQKASERKIDQELEHLRNLPLELSRQTFAVEIIPYEDLWAMLVKNFR